MKTLLLFVLLISAPLRAKEIAFTFDDAPRGDEQIYTGVARSHRLIEVLKRHHIQAAFFVNTGNFATANGRERIDAYVRAGHLIANHTHEHTRLTKESLPLFLKDIDRTHELIKSYATFRPWFRFPYLREGETTEVRDAARKHLKQLGLTNGYVTVDNYDYFINDLVQRALKHKKAVDLARACDMLSDLMMDGIKFYDDVARQHLRQIRHVLLMHENDLEAHCLESLIVTLHKEGWEIASPDRAFSDETLKDEPDTLYLGQGRVAALAHLKTGVRYVSKWENEAALETEFKRRKIIR